MYTVSFNIPTRLDESRPSFGSINKCYEIVTSKATSRPIRHYLSVAELSEKYLTTRWSCLQNTPQHSLQFPDKITNLHYIYDGRSARLFPIGGVQPLNKLTHGMCLAEGGGGSTPTSVENHEDSLTQVCLQHFGQAAIKAC